MENDLEDFDFDEIVEFVSNKLERLRKYNRMGEYENIVNLLGLNLESYLIKIETLDDEIKYEHLSKIFHKYSTTYIEEKLPL